MPLGAFRLNGIARFTVTAVAEVIRRKIGVTALGNAQIDTAQIKIGRGSALFDGTGDWLSVEHYPQLDFGTGPFTIECWVYISTYVTNTSFWCSDAAQATGNYQFSVTDVSPNTRRLCFFDGPGTITIQSSSQVPTAQWVHVAVSREGTGTNETRLFIDGVLEASGTVSTNYTFTDGYRIGRNRGGTAYLNGYIDEFRISNVARYTTGFTPTTTQFVNDENTLLLLHMDGTDASTYFEDDNGVRDKVGIWAIGNAQIDNTESKFGGTSLMTDTTGDSLRTGYGLIPSTGDFTVEYWWRAKQSTINRSQFGQGDGTTYEDLSVWALSNRSGIVVRLGANGNFVLQIVAYFTFTADTWYHIALVRNSNTFTVYINGTNYGSDTTTQAISQDVFRLCNNFTTGATGWGWWDELRISNVARYTSNFTEPTAPFVNDDNTLLLLHMDGTDASTVFTDDNGVRARVGVAAVGNAQVDTAESKFGGASLLLDGTGDYLSLDKSVGDFGSNPFTVEAWVRVPSGDSAFESIVSNWHNTATSRTWFFGVDDSTSRIVFYWYDTSNNIDTSMETTSVLSADTWHHVAISSDGTTFRLFFDGALEDTATAEQIRAPHVSSSVTIGANHDASLPLNGWIDEVRISDTARYTSAFTPPTAPFQNDSNTLLLLHMDGTDASTVFIDDNGVTPDWEY